MATTRIGVLISGRGSNMKSIISACAAGEIPARVSLVVSNRGDAAGLGWAREHGLAAVVLPHHGYPDRESHDLAIVTALREAAVDWVCLAGYMRLLSPAFVTAYRNRILNVHPSLLPAFPGLHAQRQAWEYGVTVSGCTVHLVDDHLDHGPIVVQRAVPVPEKGDADALAAAILVEEHRAYPLALRRLLTEPWEVVGRRVVFGPGRPYSE